jgi:hypothetical protein
MLMQVSNSFKVSTPAHQTHSESSEKSLMLWSEPIKPDPEPDATLSIPEAMMLIDTILPKTFNDIHSFVFQQSWLGKSYSEMADICTYNESYIKSIGSSIWKSLSEAINQPVSKNNLRSCLEAYARRYFSILPEDQDNVWV